MGRRLPASVTGLADLMIIEIFSHKMAFLTQNKAKF
jgi:hypothetical protein